MGIARQIARLVADGHQVALVSSGANRRRPPGPGRVSSTARTYRSSRSWRGLPDEADADVGRLSFPRDNDRRADPADPRRSGRPPGLFERPEHVLALLERQVVPIINENDVVRHRGNQYCDNDNLSALVANLIDADLLISITDQEGLYGRSRRHSTRRDSEGAVLEGQHGPGRRRRTSRGTGGMATKLRRSPGD